MAPIPPPSLKIQKHIKHANVFKFAAECKMSPTLLFKFISCKYLHHTCVTYTEYWTRILLPN